MFTSEPAPPLFPPTSYWSISIMKMGNTMQDTTMLFLETFEKFMDRQALDDSSPLKYV